MAEETPVAPRRRCCRRARALLTVLFSIVVWAIPWSLAAEPAIPLSPRNANYDIEVEFFPDDQLLAGQQILRWTNRREQPTDQLWFHLYWNAWRNDRSTWMLEDRIRGRSDRGSDIAPGDWAWQVIDGARLLAGAFDNQAFPEVDLGDALIFAAPDDGNQQDRTVVMVQLPRDVQPGETIRVEFSWRAKVPRTFARTGYRGDFFFFAHWFPKLGVYESRGWNCHQFHAATEFYSDYGNYEVQITLPSNYVVGSSGVAAGTTETGQGTTTHAFRAHDVHGFAWTASPDYQVREATFSEPGLPAVNMRLLIQPEHLRQAERHFEATRAALKHYGSWYGPYPYDHLTIVDPAYRSGAAGMEYPTFFTCGSRLFNPVGGDSPEGVTVHEAGHQFWYGIVGNNEFEQAWLDEGLNTYSDARTLDAAYPPRKYVARYLRPPDWSLSRGFIPVRFRELEVSRWSRRVEGLRAAPHDDVPADPTYLYYPGSAGTISYSQTALWLRTLERYLGWEVFQPIMATFFDRYKFKHPKGEDFIAVANELSPENLDWFFDQVQRGSVEFDYAIRRVESFKASPKGWVDEDGKIALAERKRGAALYLNRVVVQRRGDGIFPVDVKVVFEDGSEAVERWDGRSRWKMFTFRRDTRIDHAIVDPQRVLMLDTHPRNNARLRQSKPALPASKWTSKWMIWMQDYMTSLAFFL